jgi:hypothetical protein
VGTVRNKSSEHIEVATFIGDIERAFVNSNKVRVVATAEEREEIRDERMDQGKFASDETIKRFGQEQGADYMLIGTISSIIDQEGGDEVRFYQVDMTLVDIATNEKTWIGQKQIKKFVGRGAYRLTPRTPAASLSSCPGPLSSPSPGWWGARAPGSRARPSRRRGGEL